MQNPAGAHYLDCRPAPRLAAKQFQKFLASNKVSGIRTDDARSISNVLQFLGGEATLDPKQILQARRESRGRVGLDSP
jgi:hypothetical protein